MSADRWDPARYEQFRAERMQPFFDLRARIDPAGVAAAVDLGCGTGELTVMLAEHIPGLVIDGVDASPAMLARAAPRATERVRFRAGDLTTELELARYDLVFSNAALQWAPDSERALARICATMRPGAQLAVQMPQNFAHASHTTAADVARLPRFAAALAGVPTPRTPSLERSAEVLHAHGLRDAWCIEKIYGHVLPSTDAVVDWVRGTLLTAYLAPLDAAASADFLAEYTARLQSALGAHAPYFYPFRRQLLVGRKG